MLSPLQLETATVSEASRSLSLYASAAPRAYLSTVLSTGGATSTARILVTMGEQGTCEAALAILEVKVSTGSFSSAMNS